LDLSIVVPIFNEEENVSDLHREVVAALEKCEIAYELILVDDGSTDNSLRLLREIAGPGFSLSELGLEKRKSE